MMLDEHALLPNPYTLQPIRQQAKLSGRSDELNRIAYYLKLLGSGNSNHLAIIGERGSGKTSLLNATEAIAIEHKLTAIRVNLDEGVSNSSGHFWHHVYASTLLKLGDAGCWGGVGGEIYSSLFQMIHAHKLVALDKAVLQFPVAMATHEGSLSDLLCPEALIARDFDTILAELRRNDRVGMVLLIDEGDCLGANRPLMQMFRNIFQQATNCSLILAGTEAIFPALTDVFSPIPRQFHRIAVAPFVHWTQSLELISKPFSDHKEIGDDVLPSEETVIELHELCSGEPQELQLYCHHMYRLVETEHENRNQIARMSLRPEVFREVSKAYRATAPQMDDRVLDAVEALPDEILFETAWLRQRRITRQDQIWLQTFSAELQCGVKLQTEAIRRIATNVDSIFAALHRAGISTQPDEVKLAGGALTAGFWKSYAGFQKGARWYWTDETIERATEEAIREVIATETAADVMTNVEEDFVQLLDSLRNGQPAADMSAQAVHVLITIARIARRKKLSDDVVEVHFAFAKRQKVTRFDVLYLTNEKADAVLAQIDAMIATKLEVLKSYDMELTVEGVETWQLPTNYELHRLGRIARVYIPESDFGPSLTDLALEHHDNGRYDEAANVFKEMMNDRESGETRNNAAYCLTMAGEFKAALEIMKQSPDNGKAYNEPYIWQHNLALLTYLSGELDQGKALLSQTYQMAKDDHVHEMSGAHCMMILSKDRKSVTSRLGIPIDAAILVNLTIMGGVELEETVSTLRGLYPDEYMEWIEWVE